MHTNIVGYFHNRTRKFTILGDSAEKIDFTVHAGLFWQRKNWVDGISDYCINKRGRNVFSMLVYVSSRKRLEIDSENKRKILWSVDIRHANCFTILFALSRKLI